MKYIIRTIFFLVIAAALGLLGYAVFSDLPAPVAEISAPIDAM